MTNTTMEEKRAREVIQADREAAATNILARLKFQHGREQPWMDASTQSMRMGEQDDHWEVQAFALHRQTFADEARVAERERVLSELWDPSEDVWGNLPRHMIMWLDMSDRPTPGSLRKHLGRAGCEIPDWLNEEPEMQWADHVISKGTRAVMIYRAMLPAALRTRTAEKE